MGLFSWFRKAEKPDTGVGKLIINGMSDQAQWPNDNYTGYVNFGFNRNELVFACINKIMDSFSEAPLRIYDADDKEKPNSKFRVLIKRPNPFMTEVGLWNMTQVYYRIAGNAYLEKIRNRAGQVVELWPLRPDHVKIVPSNETFISHYIYDIMGVKYPIPREDIIHFKNPNPLNQYFGMPFLKAGLRATAVDNESTDFIKVMLQNNAIPGVVIKIPTKAGEKDPLNEALRNRLVNQFKQKFGGEKRGEPAIITNEMDIKPIGMNITDMAFPDLRGTSESRICMIYRVPPILIGAKVGLDRSTFANYFEARKSFYLDTISPEWRKFEDKLDMELVPEFEDESYNCKFDKSDIPAFQEMRNEKMETVNSAIVAGYILVNEARAEIDLDPTPNGNVFLRGLAISAIPADEKLQVIPPGQEPVKSKIKRKTNDFDRLRVALGRVTFAERYADKFKDISKKEFKKQSKDVIKIINDSSKAFSGQVAAEIIAGVKRVRRGWAVSLSGGILPVMSDLMLKSAGFAVDELGLDIAVDNARVLDFVNKYSFKFAEKVSDTSVQDVRDVILKGQTEGQTIAEIKKGLLTKFDEWDKVRAESVARSEVIRSSNQGAKLAYQEAGITKVTWSAVGDACPYCLGLHGTTIGINENFIDNGQSYLPEGAERPLIANYGAVDTPPAHPQCRCAITAA